jgi:hypothetical protein
LVSGRPHKSRQSAILLQAGSETAAAFGAGRCQSDIGLPRANRPETMTAKNCNRNAAPLPRKLERRACSARTSPTQRSRLEPQSLVGRLQWRSDFSAPGMHCDPGKVVCLPFRKAFGHSHLRAPALTWSNQKPNVLRLFKVIQGKKIYRVRPTSSAATHRVASPWIFSDGSSLSSAEKTALCSTNRPSHRKPRTLPAARPANPESKS